MPKQMKIIVPVILFLFIGLSVTAIYKFLPQPDVSQVFESGSIMMDTGYSDMPYMVVLPNGEILSTLTVSDGKEGNDDQHIVIMISADGGYTWGTPIPLEPADGPEASWAMPYLDGNRVYVFYNYNVRDVRYWQLNDNDKRPRVDLLGELAVRYSDDYGLTWSDRVIVPIPRTQIDAENGFNGEETIFWLAGAPVKIGGYIYMGLSKGGFSEIGNILPQTEGFLLRTTNPLDPDSYELLPEGERGFTNPDKFNSVSEETSLVEIGEGGIYVVFRTTTGKLAQAVSMDNGQTWQTDWARYTDGRPVNNPRAKAKVFRLNNGTYILWFHDNDNRSWFNRNPVFLSCGVQTQNGLRWGEPLKILFDPDPEVRISYPSFVEYNGQFLISATNKSTARVFHFDQDRLCR